MLHEPAPPPQCAAMSESDEHGRLERHDHGLHLVSGANGSGKSTLARELAVGIPGAQLLSAESQQQFYEAQLADDEANFSQGRDTSVTVNALLGERGRAHPLFRAFRLDALVDRGYRLLSTGEARKVLLLRALLANPTLLVLDEPFDGLDVAARTELAAAIVATARATPLLVVGSFRAAHSPFALEALDAVSVIAHGRTVFHGSAEEWLARDAGSDRAHRAPPVHLGSFYAPLDPATPLVELRRGRVKYGDDVVFEDLDFTVHAGQHTLIEGPNGSGKSTLLEMITGDHPQAYSNDLHLFGRRRGSGETIWDIKQNVGIVSSRLHRDYRVGGSVEDVLISGLFDSIGVYREREPSHRARALAWLEWLELEAVRPDTAFRELSFGQQRLVLIARAAIKVPPLVAMDEPTTGLDEDNRARVLELVESLCGQRKSTLLLVTHRDEEREFWQRRIGGARLALRSRLP
jgi:molybdate transport system ATP-binding protein